MGDSWPDLSDPRYENALKAVLHRGVLSDGPAVAALEQGFSDWMLAQGAPGIHAAAVSSGTAALQVILEAAGIGPGYEVICPSLTFTASALSIVRAGAEPVFVDVLPGRVTLGASEVENAITPRTGAIMAVDLDGSPYEVDLVRELAAKNGLFVVEDACPAHGSRFNGRPAGTFGDAAAFSFHQTKKCPAGEGGIVVSADEGLIRRVRRLSRFGEFDPGAPFRTSDVVGANWKMPEVAAAVATVSVVRLTARVLSALKNASILDQVVDSNQQLGRTAVPSGSLPAWHKYRVWAGSRAGRDALVRHMEMRVPFMRQEVSPLPRHPAFSKFRSHGHANAQDALDHTVVLGSRANPLWHLPDGEAQHWGYALKGFSHVEKTNG